MKNLHLTLLALMLSLFAWSSMTLAAESKELYKPFILAGYEQGTIGDVSKKVSDKLIKAGFEIVGEYSPYPDAHIIVITNSDIKATAAKSPMGAFGAGQRVTLTKADGKIQVSYTNPVYISNVYRMSGDLSSARSALEKALGNNSEYGPKEGLPAKELRDYQYKWLMPYFTDTLDLASYSNQKVALEKVNKFLANNKAGVSKVYEIDLPGKEESVIGVAMSGKDKDDCSGDQYIMSRIDFKKIKSTGHLPYEVVISKGKVYALPAEFRIAINFPDLSMMGSNSFASIMCAPDSIKYALTKAVGGSIDEF
ncbi:MAG: hypothetical protein PVG20_09585 [Thioalkalispiraceae bacterium]|jgi:hypothetical protein